jgi:flagellar biosynthetic protein FlhB
LAEEQAGEKTEAPTPRRREQAKEKGDRLTSRELATALAGIAGALWIWGWSDDLARGMHSMMASSLSFGRADILSMAPIETAAQLLRPLGSALAVLAAMALVAAALGQGATGGIALTWNLLLPKADRLNPFNGLKRMFGPKGLIELAKALLKAVILIGLSAWLLADNRDVILRLSAMPVEVAVRTAGDLGVKLFIWLSLGLALIAAVDLPVQVRHWLQRLRMTRQDVRDELKQQEGSPEVKYALRRMAREGLKRANRAAMAEATVVLTNPTHFAVALRYRPEEDSAPLIVARGRGIVAEVIRELAADQGTMLLSYPSVTRALYFTGRVGMLIRADLYAAVATILAFVLRVEGGGDPPPVEAPSSAFYDEDGRQVVAPG